MVMGSDVQNSVRIRSIVIATCLLAAELGIIGALFSHIINFTCDQNWPPALCHTASATLTSLYCTFAGLLVFSMVYPRALPDLVSSAGHRQLPLALNFAGFAITILPVIFLRNGVGSAAILPAFACWFIGTMALVAGLCLYLAPASSWRGFLANYWSKLVPILVIAAGTPWLAIQIRPLWYMETVSDLTFGAVAFLIRLAGYDVEILPGTKVIGSDVFAINVDAPCSGVEGFALVSVFVTFYLWLFRKDLRFPRAFLLYPLGLTASAIFNVVRIAVLLIIGLEGNPDLAVGAFHSHAGWLMFTLVAVGLVALAQTQTWIQKPLTQSHMTEKTYTSAGKSNAGPQPFFKDSVAAHILPFAIFMFSALLAQAFAQNPGVVYPLRVLAMSAVLAIFLPIYVGLLNFRADPVAIMLGSVVGIAWVFIPVPSGADVVPYGTLEGVLLVGWFLLRGLGTICLVPIIEELFFRGYLESRLQFREGFKWKVLAALMTSACFAALHDRWAEAFAAGLVFSYVVQRRGGRLSDAIISHAVANAIVFAFAVGSGNLTII